MAEFKVMTGALSGAAKSYGDASSEYDEALRKLYEGLDALSGAWKDQAGGNWETVVVNIKKSLDGIKGTLASNAAFLAKVASTASQMSQEVAADVNKIW